jgi:hypothetical protein
VNSEFLLYLLKRSGFGEKWRASIAHCIYTVRLLGEFLKDVMMQILDLCWCCGRSKDGKRG